ncbi:MAG: superinfection immunity protein [Candidatus Binataceae bacterium]
MAIFYYCVPLLVTLAYFLPTAAAINRHHPAFHSVFILNLFFGWTIVGWFAALSWATRREQPRAAKNMGYRITPFGAVPIHPRIPDSPTPAQQGKRTA